MTTHIPLHRNQRYNFTAIMREFVSMGFTWTTLISEESKKEGIIGFFIQKGRTE